MTFRPFLKVLKEARFLPTNIGVAGKSQHEYEESAQALDEYVTKMYGQWLTSIDRVSWGKHRATANIL